MVEKKSRGEIGFMTGNYPFVSIIVPVLNREETIGKCIESLLSLDYPSYEIIVVDNGSTDKTREIISRYPVKLLIENKRGSYVARNKGLSIARGEIVAFTDSDCVVDRSWLKILIRNYTDEKIGGVCGEILAYKPRAIVEKFCDIIGVNRIDLINKIKPERSELKKDPNQFLSADFVTANCSFRREVILGLNGFDTEFASGGDVSFGWRVLDAGYKLIYDPEAITWHKHREDLWSFIKLFFKYGKDQPLLLKKRQEELSFIQIKTYVLPIYEFGWKSPIPLLVSIDFCNLLLLSLLMSIVSPIFLYLSLLILLPILLSTLYGALKTVKETKELKWLLLFPSLHLLRNYVFTLGRIYGGIKYKTISI